MTKEELIEKLKDIAYHRYDEENAHHMADRLLLRFINDIEVTEAFDAINKWYA